MLKGWIGLRVLKTAIAVAAAVGTAQLLNLSEPMFAGVLAILGVEVTRRSGFRSLFERLSASLVALLVSSLLFELLGYHIWTAALYVLLVFPILSRLRLQSGIVPGSVLVFHVYGAGAVTVELLWNEALLLLVGLGWAAIVNNLYMPDERKRLQELRRTVEGRFAGIFAGMASVLRDPGCLWSGGELLEADAAVREGLERAMREQHNRPWQPDFYWTSYFNMRKRQLEIIGTMMELLSYVYDHERLPQGGLLAELFDTMEGDIRSDYYEDRPRAALNGLRASFRTMELPRTREEFEVRSALLQLTVELDRFLDTASRLKKRRLEERG
ncbi:aromatic acid exporter family protein [Paenibacillus pasadenensis]|uniref:aromatic acid exporter family protein n=1 Tax=Paenibacillus pasadenensis TaxID=217090 RepID=UPI00203D880A|nr:aromatic acid exporter family protein [Paenibacillus pasadenensis]MCM3748988.1 aromatic acid exporter family protein [Paenibacillus pasadenensis]